MRGNRQTSATPANVFPMEAFQNQANVNLLSKPLTFAGGKAVTPLSGDLTKPFPGHATDQMVCRVVDRNRTGRRTSPSRSHFPPCPDFAASSQVGLSSPLKSSGTAQAVRSERVVPCTTGRIFNAGMSRTLTSCCFARRFRSFFFKSDLKTVF